MTLPPLVTQDLENGQVITPEVYKILQEGMHTKESRAERKASQPPRKRGTGKKALENARRKYIDQLLGPEAGALSRLMHRDKVPGYFSLSGEQKLSIELYDSLRAHITNGRLRGMALHIANEGKRGWGDAIISIAMGMISGALDYLFIWHTGNGLDAEFIELKFAEQPFSGSQKDFMLWLDMGKISHSEFRCPDLDSIQATVAQIEARLIERGALCPSR